MNKTATLIGASGLIGGELLEILKQDSYFSSVKVVTRRPLGVGNDKVQEVVIDFGDQDAYRQAISGSSAVFCAIGTTQNKVKGNKVEYRKVDYDIPVNAAKCCAETGCKQFLLVSSVGANSQSSNFYLKLKGEVEDALCDLDIPSIHIFRPSMLLGKRKEFRFGEAVGKVLALPMSFMFPSKYKPIKARTVASAMVAAAKREGTGLEIWHFGEMKGIRKRE